MRAGRVVRLLDLLQIRGRLTAGELARELEVSERTVMRDVEALSGAGVPVYAHRGPAGGYELLDGFERRLPPIAGRASRSGTAERGRLQRVRVRLSPGAAHRMLVLGRPEGWRPRPGARPAEGREGWLEGSVRVASHREEAVADLLALGPQVEVLLPLELRAAMADAGRELAALNGLPAAGVPPGAQPPTDSSAERAGSGPT